MSLIYHVVHRAPEAEACRVKDLLDSAARHWANLPDWIRSLYDKGNVVFGRSSIFLTGRLAGLDDWIVYSSETGILEIYTADELPLVYDFRDGCG